MIMELETLYKYAYRGVIDHIKILTKLYNMCVEVGDGDAASEYEIQIENSKSDFNNIVLCLGYDLCSCYEILDYEIRKVC